MNKTNVYSVNGEVSGNVDVPAAFNTPYRPDIIKKAVLAAAANGRQPYGPSPRSGMRHSVSTWGKGRNNVSGRRAHPPRPERKWAQKVNTKELSLARKSALAATGSKDCVKQRGHQFEDALTFPLVVDDAFQDIQATSEVYEVLNRLGIGYDVDRAKDGTKIRAGKGKMRNRRYRTPVSILIVVDSRDAPVAKGANNLPGVEVEAVSNLNTSTLAPGGDAGRLTVFTRSAFEKIGGWTQ